MIEVEFKFCVESLTEVRRRCLDLGATPESTAIQTDEYLNDPIRDFSKTDQALRIRNSDGVYCLTYKGPNLDPEAKIREEIEISLDEVASLQMKAMFEGIGFVSVAKVVKQRETLVLEWQGAEVHVCLDEVAQVGQFVELEMVVADEAAVPSAKNVLLGLCERLDLKGAIRTSYLEMLLSARGDLEGK